MHTCAYCCFASLNHEKANGKVVGLVESAVFLRNAMFEKKKRKVTEWRYCAVFGDIHGADVLVQHTKWLLFSMCRQLEKEQRLAGGMIWLCDTGCQVPQS